MTETERAIAIIEARLPLYTDIGQINALRECISSIRSAALSAGQAQPVAIKPLEWELINGWWFGPTAEGQNYIVRASSATNFKGQWLWGLGVDKYELAPSLEAAKAAAQSDYEARIRAALVGVGE